VKFALIIGGLIVGAASVLFGWNWVKAPDVEFQRAHRTDYDGYRLAKACHGNARYTPSALGYVGFLFHGRLRDALTVERELDDQWSKQLVIC